MRCLWDVFRYISYDEKSDEDKRKGKEDLKVQDLYGLLWRGVTLYFVAPLLAYALYFAISLSGMDSLLAFGFSSIALGLIAEDMFQFIQD